MSQIPRMLSMKTGLGGKAWWLLAPILMAVAAINGGSFWIDECITSAFVSQSSLAGWWQDLRAATSSEAQMPFYLFYLWVWDKLFGHGEWSLRLAALPWFVPGVGVFLYSLRQIGSSSIAAILVTCSNCFLWYYLNEARPYAPQIGISCLIFGALVLLHERVSSYRHSGQFWFVVLNVGVVLLSASSVIGMIWVSAVMIAMWVLFPPSVLKELVWSRRKFCVVVVVLLGLLGIYYLGTVMRGSRATAVGTTNLQTVVFVFYEQLGFMGLGPGRADLREHGVRSLFPFAPLLIAYAASVGFILITGLKTLWRSSARNRTLWIGAGIAFPILLLLAIGVITHFRVLGRHLTPLMPVWLCILSIGATQLWSRRFAGKLVVVIFISLSVASVLEIRWAYRHLRDDYRSAAAFSKAALNSGQTVWWNAAEEGARYYGLALTDDPKSSDHAFLMFNPNPDKLKGLAEPDFVVVSKPDTFDEAETIMNHLQQSGYRPVTNFPAFVIWGRKE